MKTYKINTITSILGDEFTTIISTDENGLVSSIPIDPANSDYQEYLKSLEAEQSTPSVE
jgi:hypothetical protein